jgi:ATP-dependent DNA helicase RecQ
MHDFFLERDYPAATELARVANLLTPDLQHPEDLARRLRMDPDTLANALGKLASQGAASFDIEGNVRATGNTNWRSGYDAQLSFRRAQIDRMAAFAEAQQCRMTALIQHFGDTADGLRPCGHCDFCSPESTTAQSFREPTCTEQRQLRLILNALEGNGRSTGKLFTDLSSTSAFRGLDRKDFEALLDALGRAGFVTLASDSFTSRDDGRQITYKKATITHEGRFPEEGDLPVTLRDSGSESETPARKRKSASGSRTRPPAEDVPLSAFGQALEAALRAWRKAEAAKTGKPAFIVLPDRTLLAIAAAAPTTLAELARVPGIGPDKSEKYGAILTAICRGDQPAAERPSSAAPAHSNGKHSASRPKAAHSNAAAKRPLYAAAAADSTARRQPEAVSRPSQTQAPQDLTPAQQALDSRLRQWRAAEAERLNLPQFFVLGSSTLRSIVLRQPRTLSDLRSVDGLGPEKSERFGPAILEVLNHEQP